MDLATTGHSPSLVGSRSHMDQDAIDKMTALRQKGVSFKEIGRRARCSERTARRWVGKVVPKLHSPGPELAFRTDPRAIRELLLDEFMALLYANEELRSVTVVWTRVGGPMSECFQATYGGPPSILFLSEAERLLGDRLAKTGPRALQLLTRTEQSNCRFIREVIGPLFADYIGWHRFAFEAVSGYNETGEDWRPPSERSGKRPKFDHVDLFDLAKLQHE
jgi:hypothetical protein